MRTPTKRKRPRPLTVDEVCAALNHLSGSAPRVRLAGVAEIAARLERDAHLAAAAAAGPRPETSLAILVMALERAKWKTDEIVRGLAALPAADEVRP